MKTRVENLIKEYILSANLSEGLSARGLALRVYSEVDSNGDTPIDLQWFTVNGVTALARTLLRKSFEFKPEEDIQMAFEFAGKLQQRYSVKRDDTDIYLGTEFLTYCELTIIADKCAKVSKAWNIHQDAVLAYRDTKQQNGSFNESA